MQPKINLTSQIPTAHDAARQSLVSEYLVTCEIADSQIPVLMACKWNDVAGFFV